MITTFADRLNFAMDKTGKTAYKMSQQLQLAQSTISKYRKPEDKDFRPKSIIIKSIAAFLRVPDRWLEYGEGEFEIFPDDEVQNMMVNEAAEQMPNKAGNVTEELANGKYRLWTKKLPIRAFASYLSEFRNVSFYEELEDVSWVVDHNPRGRYMTIETEGDSMNGGGINDTPDRADMLGRELQRHHWKDGFRESIYGWVIVHRETVVFKDIKSFDKLTGDIVCSSRSGLPQHPDFTINLNDVLEIWKVIKRSF
ncbi:hypothetical protein [Flavobacterium caeni]|uniref:HTH cro/C1-type domain-containing protein n=1 Tax=Flavobacterium caeni TaxID=490189 RepID=A0A1G5K2I6_9FLAO|nr:hypothetical protein [Flavobacterium caeni]SCY94228.1 hypothetical protein SAMN02927903_03014 [Flavobacterium caeni]